MRQTSGRWRLPGRAAASSSLVRRRRLRPSFPSTGRRGRGRSHLGGVRLRAILWKSRLSAGSVGRSASAGCPGYSRADRRPPASLAALRGRPAGLRGVGSRSLVAAWPMAACTTRSRSLEAEHFHDDAHFPTSVGGRTSFGRTHSLSAGRMAVADNVAVSSEAQATQVRSTRHSELPFRYQLLSARVSVQALIEQRVCPFGEGA